MNNYFVIGHIKMKGDVKFPITGFVINNDFDIIVTQKGKDIEFKLHLNVESNRVDLYRIIKDNSSKEINIYDNNIAAKSHVIKRLGYIDLRYNKFIEDFELDNLELKLKTSSEKIIIEIFKYVFDDNKWDIPTDFELILEVNENEIKKTIIDISNSTNKGELESKEKSICNNCMERNDCFYKDDKKLICEDYKPGPNKTPSHWPKEMITRRGGYL